MKKIIIASVLFFIAAELFSQFPQKMTYQAVVRDPGSVLITDSPVGIQISILQGSSTGTVVYSEAQNQSTNTNGLLTIEIGGGTGFDTITWANGPYYLKTEIDPSGGTTYTVTSVSQLLSVPFALHAKTAENALTTETDPVYSTSEAVNITAADITNLSNLSGTNTGDQNLAGYVENADLSTVVPANETDPVFSIHPSYGISSTNITNWNTAYSWGNHASIGYLTSITETDPVFSGHASFGISSTNITNWNTAYGWGNHVGLYRPVSYVPDWTEITSKPTTISGYGITDAVTLTGNQTIGGNKTFTGTISASNLTVTNVANPVNTQDAATKNYVDASVAPLVTNGVNLGDMQYWDGTDWQIVPAGTQGQFLTNCYGIPTWTTSGDCPPFSIGDTGPAGGLVFYDKGAYSAGWRYLEAAPLSTEWSVKQWGCSGTATGATATAIGTGEANTATIVSLCAETNRAAKLCSDLVYGMYDDWFLPSESELNLIYTNLYGAGLGGFSGASYWSSTESSALNARKQNFGNGFVGTDAKTLIYYVRAIRAF